jgi:outer membrane cobalamin receptor
MRKSNSIRKILGSFILSIFTGLTFAQEIDSVAGKNSLPSQTLSEVVITANRYGSVQLKTPEAIRVVDSKSIEKFQFRTAPEALLLSPGVFVQKTNHGGGSPFLRGLTGNQTLLLIDGIRLSNSTMRYGPNQYFNTIDVFSLEKIEVLRGSGSVQYGSDAIGGTVQAFSSEVKTSEKSHWGGTLQTRISTHGMEKSLNGGINYSSKRIAFRAGVTRRDFGDLVGGDTTGRQSPTGYRELDFDLKAKVLISQTADLTLAYQKVRQSDVDVFHKVALENYAVNKMDPQKRELGYIKLNQKINAGILKSAVVTASFQRTGEERELLKNNSSMYRTENDRVRTFAFSAEAFASGDNGWSSNNGLEIYNDQVNSSRTDKDLTTDISILKRGLYPDGATMTSIAIFSMHTLDLQKWNVSAGVRYNSFINKVNDDVLGMTKLTPSALVGNLAVLRKLDKSSNIFVSINSGFRAPNIDDLGTLGIVDFRYETPNFDLKPEHSFQYQIGYKYRDNKLRGEIYFYRNELYNLIVRSRIAGDSIEGYPVYMKENIERAYIQGAETAWDFELNDKWMISGSMTYTYGQNITRKEPARRIPPVFGRLAAEYKTDRWWINLEWQAAGKQGRLAQGDKEDNRIPSGGTPGWNIVNINTSYSLGLIRFDLSLVNLFNKDYRFHGSGVNAYGRSAFLSMIFRI